MSIKQDSPFANGNATDICFGLNRRTDERSLAIFLQRFAREELLTTLLPRLTDAEIVQTLDLLSGQLRAHLKEKEYHALFLRD